MFQTEFIVTTIKADEEHAERVFVVTEEENRLSALLRLYEKLNKRPSFEENLSSIKVVHTVQMQALKGAKNA